MGRPADGLERLRAAVAEASGSHLAPQWAVVAGDWKSAADTARVALGEPTESLIAAFRAYIRTLYALVADDRETAASELERLRTYVSGGGGRQEYPRGAAAIAEGLVTASTELVTKGLDELLGWHLRRARARSEIFNSARAVVSLDAVFVLLVAHRLGLAPEVAPRYRSSGVPMLVLHVHQWDGQPLPRALPLTAEVDLVAAPWLRAQGLPVDDLSPDDRS